MKDSVFVKGVAALHQQEVTKVQWRDIRDISGNKSFKENNADARHSKTERVQYSVSTVDSKEVQEKQEPCIAVWEETPAETR
ncbi:hypothetical protein NQZ68_002918 [Dissostichus eleginoides]|nr:hypothetical protein NQZ68_002918 [Dissostichus eleginoides]